MSLLVALDLAAVIVFALTGALVASRAQLDIVGFVFVASLTAVGGGTVRDLLLDRQSRARRRLCRHGTRVAGGGLHVGAGAGRQGRGHSGAGCGCHPP